ncbi:unnamed protein product [Cylicostephanus goldi]|uniref:Uncharacterized protein n=1 Tax=Cylicostephanus goldi TaxID=71465 RepID=A0A3P7N609_CYLGO|nr:unnamed protein product [Cylicostephanus goldi]
MTKFFRSASLRGSPFQPPPSSVAQFPSVPNFPPNTQAVNGLPQNGPVTTAQPYANVNGPSSAFKPFGTAPTPPIPPGATPTPPIPPSFPGPHTTMPSPAYPLGNATPTPLIPSSFAGINSAIPPPANPAGTATPPIPPSFPGGSVFPPAPQRPVHPGTYQPAAGLPPAPVSQNNSYNHQTSSPFPAQGMPPPMPPMPPIQAKAYHAPSTHPAPSTPTAGMPPSMNQMQQGFSQMNMGPMTTAPHQAHPSWTGAYQNDSRMASSPPYQSDIVDLMAERNILQSGFDDIEYSLPHNMANNTARVDPA